MVLDVRSRSEYARDGVRIPDSNRVLPDQVTEWAADRLRDQPYKDIPEPGRVMGVESG